MVSFTPKERAPGIHWIRGCVGPRTDLDAVSNSQPPPGIESRSDRPARRLGFYLWLGAHKFHTLGHDLSCILLLDYKLHFLNTTLTMTGGVCNKKTSYVNTTQISLFLTLRTASNYVSLTLNCFSQYSQDVQC
jgi:hypothetical protein